MKKLIALSLCCASLIGVLAGCGGGSEPAPSQDPAPVETPAPTPVAPSNDGDPVYGGTLRVALNRTVSAKSLDPLYVDSTTADQICQNYGDTLVRANEDMSVYGPNIATDWTISEDGKTYVFQIRDDVYFQPGKFQDGRQLTAEDVAYSVNRAKGYWCNYLYFVDYAEATGEFECTVHLLDANATFLHELTSSSVLMLPKEEVEGWGEEFGMHVVSTGPFQVVEHVPDQYTKLVKFDKYWGVEPYLDNLEYYIITDEAQALNALKAGEIDIVLSVSGNNIVDIKNTDGLVLTQNAEARVAYMGYNLENPILSDKRVRDALSMAIDRKTIVDGVYANGDGSLSYLPVPKMSWAYDEALESLAPAYDPEGAKALLAEAGYPNGFDIRLTVGTGEAYVRAATIIQAMLSQIGVNVQVDSLASAEVTERYLNGTNELWISGQGGSADPGTFVGYFLSSAKVRTNYNAYNYNNPETDKIIAEAVVLSAREDRAPLYEQLIREAMETNIGVYYATTNLSWAISEKVQGWVQENKAVLRVCGTEGTGINIWIAE